MKKRIDVMENYESMFSEELLMFYKGPFNNKILSGIGSYIREILVDNPELSYKVFSIFIELAQNIYFHSEDIPTLISKPSAKYGTLLIEEYGNEIIISAGNFIKNEDIEDMQKQVDKINSLDNDNLRKFKKDMRKLERGVHGEANIGLIQVALTSASPIVLETNTVKENYSFITISTTITK